jgi:hypothetical protein
MLDWSVSGSPVSALKGLFTNVARTTGAAPVRSLESGSEATGPRARMTMRTKQPMLMFHLGTNESCMPLWET